MKLTGKRRPVEAQGDLSVYVEEEGDVIFGVLIPIHRQYNGPDSFPVSNSVWPFQGEIWHAATGSPVPRH